MKHVTSLPKHLGVLMIAVLLQWCVMPILAQNLKPEIKISNREPSRPREEKIKLTTPEKEGYTLLNTKTGDIPTGVLKCDYYMEGVRTFRFPNGDFITYVTDDHESPAIISKPSSTNGLVGDWRITLDNGVVAKREDGVCKIELLDGSVLVKRDPIRVEPLSSKERGIYFYIRGMDLRNCDLLYLPDRKEPLEFKQTRGSGFYQGYLLGDRLYEVVMGDENPETVRPYVQFFEGIPYRARMNDTIVKAVYETDFKKQEIYDSGQKFKATLRLEYANGDSIRIETDCNSRGLVYWDNMDEKPIAGGTVHINDAVLTIKTINGKKVKMLTWPDGKKFVGTFNVERSSSSGLSMKDVFNSSGLTPYEGTLIKPDGTRIQYANGKSEIEIKEELEVLEELKKRKEKMVEETYKALCQKYGKKYIDAALNGQIIVGMPEDVLLESFSCELDYESEYSKYYNIYGIGTVGHTIKNVVKAYVRVHNGKVSSVSYTGW